MIWAIGLLWIVLFIQQVSIGRLNNELQSQASHYRRMTAENDYLNKCLGDHTTKMDEIQRLLTSIEKGISK